MPNYLDDTLSHYYVRQREGARNDEWMTGSRTEKEGEKERERKRKRETGEGGRNSIRKKKATS